MATRQRLRRGSSVTVKESDWTAALGSDDPAQQWAAACSIALTVTEGDDWVDATGLHEAAVGAYEAAIAADTRSWVYQAMVDKRGLCEGVSGCGCTARECGGRLMVRISELRRAADIATAELGDAGRGAGRVRPHRIPERRGHPRHQISCGARYVAGGARQEARDAPTCGRTLGGRGSRAVADDARPAGARPRPRLQHRHHPGHARPSGKCVTGRGLAQSREMRWRNMMTPLDRVMLRHEK